MTDIHNNDWHMDGALLYKKRRGLAWVHINDEFPELAQLMMCNQSPPHIYNVWDHTRVAYNAAQLILSRMPDEIVPNIKVNTTLIAVALHDIGKPETAHENDTGKISFHCHEMTSAKIAAKMLTERGMPVPSMAKLIELHLRPAFLYREYLADTGPSKKAIIRLQNDAGGLINELCIVSVADFYAKQGEMGSAEQLRAFIGFLAILFPEEIDWQIGGGLEALILQRENYKRNAEG